jgi:hypothetical protein
MKRKFAPILFALIALFLAQLACNASASTANIKNAWMDTPRRERIPQAYLLRMLFSMPWSI